MAAVSPRSGAFIMIKNLIGTKIGMTHAYSSDGRYLPVTRLALGPCPVTQVKTIGQDGYSALQIAFGSRKRLTRPMAKHLQKSLPAGEAGGLKKSPLFIREIPADDLNIRPGDQIKVSAIFMEGDIVKVKSLTRGRGFTGVVKRWGFHGGPKTHGQSDRLRAPGAIGQGTLPGRVHKGKHMPGHYGNEIKTIKGLKVIKVDGQSNELWVKGAVAGHPQSLVEVEITKAVKRREPQNH